MNQMFIFTNYEDLHKLLGMHTVRFITDEEQLQRTLLDRDYALARGDFLGQIPTSSLVELYIKRADIEGPGEHGNDWVFANAWQAPVSREQAFERLYGRSRG